MKKSTSVISLLLFLILLLQVDMTFKLHTKLRHGIRYLRYGYTTKVQGSLESKTKYPISKHLPIVVVTATYNNEKFCKKNVQSILDQDYDNFRVIYIDDCSRDDTFALVEKHVNESKKREKFTLIHNPIRNRKMANLYKAYHSCRDDEIIVCLDGDDWFAHEGVLSAINQIYQDPDVWVTYGSAIFHPSYGRYMGKPLPRENLETGNVRELGHFEFSMPRTFYAGLFKEIRLEDFFFQERYLDMSDDVAFMFPMIEMAGEHVHFCKDIHYIINDQNPLSDHHLSHSLQQKIDHFIRAKTPYARKSDNFRPTKRTTALSKHPRVVITSVDSPLELSATIHSYKKYLKGAKDLIVIYSASSPRIEEAYKRCRETFDDILFIEEMMVNRDSLLEKSNRYASPYLIFSSDNLILSKEIDLAQLVAELEMTKASGYLIGHLGKEPLGQRITENFYAAQVKTIARDTGYLFPEHMLLASKDLFESALKSSGPSIKEVPLAFLDFKRRGDHLILLPHEKMCKPLHHPESPLHLAKESMVEKFLEGFTIDVANYTESEAIEVGENHLAIVKN